MSNTNNSIKVEDSSYSGNTRPASRFKRLIAVIIDHLIVGTISFAIYLGYSLTRVVIGTEGSQSTVSLDFYYFGYTGFDPLSTNLTNWEVYIGILIPFVVYFILNGYLLYSRGQSVGKMMVRIAIVNRHTYEIAPLTHILFKRFLLFRSVVILSGVLAVIVDIIDVCSIFRQDKRMLHDVVANTMVIQVEKLNKRQ